MIPGLDAKDGEGDGGNLFGQGDDADFDVLSVGSLTKSAKIRDNRDRDQVQLQSSERQVEKVGLSQTVFNILKVFIGIGVLTTPAAFAKIGIIGGTVGMILIGIIAAYTMVL